MTFAYHYQNHGVAIIDFALEQSDLSVMSRAFSQTKISTADCKASTQALLGAHGTLPADLADWLETHPVLLDVASQLLDSPASLIRISPLSNTSEANWLVPWHQSYVIPVTNKFPTPGYRNWTKRLGYWDVEPPIALLQQIVTLQVYLDTCGDDDGPLEVLPGTHLAGRLQRDEIGVAAATLAPQMCLADPGDIVAIHPLTLHRARRSRQSGELRVLQLEFAACRLPTGLRWASLTPGLFDV